MLNTPSVSQLTTVTGDGKPSENAQQDCTAAGVDLLCRYALGTPENSVFNPDNFHDKAYWEGYIGGTAAIEYVAFCKSLGVHLHSIDAADYAHAVTLARTIIRDKKQPCLFTRDDPYADQRVHPDWTHVCVFKGEDDAGLTAHDPYINQPVYKTDAGWASILRSSELWLAERIDEIVRIDITTPGVSYYFEVADAHHWRCKQTGHLLGYGMLDFYKGFGNAGLCGLTYLGLNKSEEMLIEKFFPAYVHLAGKGIAVQFFERGVTIYDPSHLVDNPPGAGSVYLLQLYSPNSPGVDPGIAKLQATIVDLQSKLAQGQVVDPLASQALAIVRQIKPMVQSF